LPGDIFGYGECHFRRLSAPLLPVKRSLDS
jgi:hypothetical protein